MKIIELSYDHLPNQLKPCFLYLVSLRKDSAITIYELKFLWHAEGLVEPTKMKSVEEVMDFYLDTLISSSLVILFNDIGYYSTCLLYDLLHDVCLIKAREEKLFELISSSATSSSSDLSSRQMTINYHREHFGINFVLIDTKSKRHSGKHLYSLMITGDELDDYLSDICHLRHLRLLRVFILESSFIMVKDSLLNEIFMLVHLRFLNFETEVKALPSSFSNFFNLETLIVENKGPPLVLLPRIWTLLKLRVLSIKAGSLFDFDVDEPILTTKDTRLRELEIFRETRVHLLKRHRGYFQKVSQSSTTFI
uniref:Late blight resistance protein Rpi-blb2 n=1 Tax=Solanum tuberosum TaxID=4113 RepID=M1DYB7_SOLTU